MSAASALQVAIVGAGAIGSRMAAQFEAHDLVTTLFDGWPEHVDAIRQHGLWLERGGARSHHRVPAFLFDDAKAPAHCFDAVLLAVRGDATAAALPLVTRLLKPAGYVVSCQNGINEDAIAAVVGPERTLGCSMIFGARLAGPGVVEALFGEDTLCVGEMSGPARDRTHALRDLLAFCGNASTTDALLAYRWKKLVFNCMGNPLTLLTGLVARELHAQAAAREVMIGIAREVMATARACGNEPEPVLGLAADAWLAEGAFDDASLHAALRAHGEFLDQRRFSMWADFRQRGRTEVDALNGYVAQRALLLGRKAPMNEAVTQLVHRVEDGRPLAPDRVIAELHGRLARA